MGDSIAVSDSLHALVMNAVGFAEHNLRKHGSPFVPFVIVENGEKKEFVLLEPVEPSEIQASGLRIIGEKGVQRAVLCYDGFLTIEDRRTDVIYAIGCERGEHEANIFAQPYERKRFLQQFKLRGTIARYGVVENPLRRTVDSPTGGNG